MIRRMRQNDVPGAYCTSGTIVKYACNRFTSPASCTCGCSSTNRATSRSMLTLAATHSRFPNFAYKPSIRLALLSVRCAQTRYRTEEGTPSWSSFRTFFAFRACEAGMEEIVEIHASSRLRYASAVPGECGGLAGEANGWSPGARALLARSESA